MVGWGDKIWNLVTLNCKDKDFSPFVQIKVNTDYMNYAVPPPGHLLNGAVETHTFQSLRSIHGGFFPVIASAICSDRFFSCEAGFFMKIHGQFMKIHGNSCSTPR